MKLEDAFADLDSFKLQVRSVGPESSIADHVALDDDTKRLIRLVREFGLALGEENLRKELEMRASALSQFTAPGTLFFAFPHHFINRLTPNTPAFDPNDEYLFVAGGTSLLFPIELAGYLLNANYQTNHAADDETHEAWSGWLELLRDLEEHAEQQHCWGSLIIMHCISTQDYRPEVDERSRLIFDTLRGQLPQATRAVIDAARSLMRWQRDQIESSCVPKVVAVSQATNHSPDFRAVHWFGTNYYFTGAQAACVEVLWKVWETGPKDVGDEYVLAKAGSESRIVDIFREKGSPTGHHPAWGTMIVPGHTKGSRRLQGSDDADSARRNSITTEVQR